MASTTSRAPAAMHAARITRGRPDEQGRRPCARDGGAYAARSPTGVARCGRRAAYPGRLVSPSVALGLLLALCCSVVALLGFLFKQRGAVGAPAVQWRHPVRS